MNAGVATPLYLDLAQAAKAGVSPVISRRLACGCQFEGETPRQARRDASPSYFRRLIRASQCVDTSSLVSSSAVQAQGRSPRSLHQLGVMCGLAAGAWLGAAEAPTKLVTVGFSPFIISLGMVAGVFVARWTVPVALKGTSFVMADLKEKPHLIAWGLLAGMLWAVANTLTVFAIRDVGLSIAFPLWNTNSLVGLFWGWLLFNELRGSAARDWVKVLGGAAAIVVGACVLAYATQQHSGGGPKNATLGVLAALGAGLLWGTMYIPYRKAYLSGMNPLSFVTIFTFGELGTVLALGAAFRGGLGNLWVELGQARPAMFWLFLGRILLGPGRLVPAIRRQVHRHQPRHSALEHQPALGPGLGRAGLW